MNISKYATQNPQVTVVTFLLLLILGLRSFLTMPQYEDPLVQPPGAVIIAVYPGASPTDMESLVVDPIEEAIYELDNLETMDTDIQSGLAFIQVEFKFGTDPDDKFADIQTQISSVQDELPDDLYSLDIRKKSTSDAAIYQIMMVGENHEYSVLEEEAEKIREAVEDVPGLKKVNIEAYPEQQVRIALDPARMKAAGVSLDNIEKAIQSSNANVPGGSLEAGGKLFNVQTSGFYDDLEEVRRTVVNTVQGKNVALADVATVNFAYEDDQWRTRVNGKKGLVITVQQNENVNVHDVSDELRRRIDQLTLRDGIELVYVFEQTEQVKDSVNSFLSNLLQGVILVGLIIWWVLGVRPAILVMVAIPLSIMMGLSVVDFMDLGLQQISIAGLVIALGLLVDNSIVITENIERHLNMGRTRSEAAVKGASELGNA
ncbi:MAG: efflux RND transporter permease subunit, partial [Bacteroidota bacterium]